MNAEEARALFDRLEAASDRGVMIDLLVRARDGRAYAALGYKSLNAILDDRFGGLRLRLPPAVRRATDDPAESNRAQAARQGVAKSTVGRDRLSGVPTGTPDKPATRAGLDGKTYPALRPTPTQLARRRDEAARLYRMGYAITAVAAALGVGFTAVQGDLKAKGVRCRTPSERTITPDLPSLSPVDWRTAPTDDRPPLLANYAQMWRAFAPIDAAMSWFYEDNGVQAFASDVDRAIRADDFEFVSNMRANLMNARAYIERMLGMLDAERRDHAITTASERDDLAGHTYVPLPLCR